MFPIAVAIIAILSAYKWGDWKNWQRYLPTIQYFIMGDLLYNLFTWNFPLWYYPSPPHLFSNHLMNNLFIMFTLYPSTMLIFLYRLPKQNIKKQTLYLVGWIILWIIFEFIMVYRGLCVYDNGWTFGWSIIFATTMNLMFVLHYKRPLWAYLLSVPITIFLLYWFQVPVLNTN